MWDLFESVACVISGSMGAVWLQAIVNMALFESTALYGYLVQGLCKSGFVEAIAFVFLKLCCMIVQLAFH